MAEGNGEEYAEFDPQKLTPGQWRALTDYRLKQIENRVTAIYRTLQGIAVIVVAAIIVAWLKQGGPSAAPHAIGRWFGL